MHVVICGGGVIGAATAYELSRRGARVTLVERWRVAGAASGKSGGFLARDWCRGTPIAPLAERSFDLHGLWAEGLGDRYGYRRVDTVATVLSERRRLGSARNSALASWLAPEAARRDLIGDADTTAQLDPKAFTVALVDAAKANGAELRIATVDGIRLSSGDARVDGVLLADGSDIAADAVVIAMGPWSVLAAQWLPLPPIYGLKGHSVVFRPSAAFPAETVFAEFEDADGDVLGPEIVPRPDGTLYVCGLPGHAPLPVDPADVAPEPGACERLRRVSERLVPALASAELLASQACYRPIAADGIPIIGPIPAVAGAYVATGHSVWGMLNAPGTAEALAELLLDGCTTHVPLDAFSPPPWPRLDPGVLSFEPRRR